MNTVKFSRPNVFYIKIRLCFIRIHSKITDFWYLFSMFLSVLNSVWPHNANMARRVMWQQINMVSQLFISKPKSHALFNNTNLSPVQTIQIFCHLAVQLCRLEDLELIKEERRFGLLQTSLLISNTWKFTFSFYIHRS